MSHAETIAVAIAEPDGEVRSLGTHKNMLAGLGSEFPEWCARS